MDQRAPACGLALPHHARGRSLVLPVVVLVGAAAFLVSLLDAASAAFAGSRGCSSSLRASRSIRATVPGLIARAAAADGASDAPQSKWGLHLNVTDHYIWRDEDVFMSIVSDAGEWEIDTLRVRTAWKEAMEKGSAMIFDAAPLYVVKEYVKELKSYGLRAEARESVGAADAGASVEASNQEDEGIWRRRDWNSLPPELKDELVEKGRTGVSSATARGTRAVRIARNDHPALDGSQGGMKKFRAYIELAADAANKFAPEEGEIDAHYRSITRTKEAQANVITQMDPQAAEKAMRQLKAAGFEVEVVDLEEKAAD